MRLEQVFVAFHGHPVDWTSADVPRFSLTAVWKEFPALDIGTDRVDLYSNISQDVAMNASRAGSPVLTPLSPGFACLAGSIPSWLCKHIG